MRAIINKENKIKVFEKLFAMLRHDFVLPLGLTYSHNSEMIFIYIYIFVNVANHLMVLSKHCLHFLSQRRQDPLGIAKYSSFFFYI